MLNLSQRQTLQQKLSPQQIQYIKLLQLPTLALEQRIKAEMEANPLLEEGLEEDEEPTQDEQADEPEAAADADADEPAPEPEPERDRNDEYEWDEYLHAADDLEGYKAASQRDEDEDDREMPLPATSSVSEYLTDQIGYLDLSDADRLIAEQIVGSIDEDGYLRRSLESITDDILFNYGAPVNEADVERVLKQVQRLDPVGIAARDLQECLTVQLEMLDPKTPGRDVALAMLAKAYKAFTMKHFEAIQSRLGVSAEALKEAFDLVQRLDPKPGEGAFQPQQNYVVPDFTVDVVEDEFVLSMNARNTPPLRISREYRAMLEELSADAKRERPRERFDADTKSFLKTRMESARWFIHSIQQRRGTMLRVMHAIVELQADFFRHGEGHLRPMILKDVAERIGMDISTISRVVNGKYVQTEFGVYELKYFFSEGLTTDSGEEVSNKEVRAIIDRMIAAEDKTKPLSDQHIAEALEKQGFQIARRTVTKYREQLGVPVARMRKEIVLG